MYLPPLELQISTEILYHKKLSKISCDANFYSLVLSWWIASKASLLYSL